MKTSKIIEDLQRSRKISNWEDGIRFFEKIVLFSLGKPAGLRKIFFKIFVKTVKDL